jgi:hypothetical protein
MYFEFLEIFGTHSEYGWGDSNKKRMVISDFFIFFFFKFLLASIYIYIYIYMLVYVTAESLSAGSKCLMIPMLHCRPIICGLHMALFPLHNVG